MSLLGLSAMAIIHNSGTSIVRPSREHNAYQQIRDTDMGTR